jgi:dihydroflavonol-4-reductase
MSEHAKILVTGATGFLGQHVVAALREHGREVVALVRNPDSLEARRIAKAGAILVRGDILDGDSVRAALEQHPGCTALLHCAGKVSRHGRDAIAMTKANVGGVDTTLSAAKQAGIRRVVVASTSGTIGVGTDPDYVADETSPAPLELINKWPYYRSKFYGEQVALGFDTADFEVVIVNPALLLGPGDHQGSSTEDIRRALEQRMPVVPAGGYAFVDARDAAEGMILALDKGRAGQRYLLVSCNCPIRTFFSRVARVAGLDGPMFALPDNDTVERATRWLLRKAQTVLGEDDSLPDAASIEMAQHYWYVDSTLAENELGWRPRDPMVTLADTVADLRERGVVMMRQPD